MLAQDQPEPNHNGGQLLFGPDGLLYIGLGDGGGSGRPARPPRQRPGPRDAARQDPAHRPARERRTAPTAYRARTRSSAATAPGPEIWAYGLRNPWRFAFGPRSGDLIVADVGQNEVEEVSVVRRAGANLGWRPFEGRRRFTPGESAPGHVRPVIERLHSRGNCSITGGVVVRDPVLAALRGRYVFGDFCRGLIESARIRGARARATRVTRLEVPIAVLVRRGRARPGLRDVARRARLPARPAVVLDPTAGSRWCGRRTPAR